MENDENRKDILSPNHILNVALFAESRHMSSTASHLFMVCVRELTQRRALFIGEESFSVAFLNER